MKRAMEDERFAAMFRPMRWKVVLGSKIKRAIEDERFAPRFRQMWQKMDRRRKKSAPKLQRYDLNREEEGDEKDKENTEDHELEEEDGQDDDTPTIDKETHRLAAVNMDWDHIKAVDLYMAMASRIPEGGRVLSVSIYPSEFGLKCIYIEKTLGPSALIGADDSEEDTDLDSETENYNNLRTYELNRLGYYYAVVVCDSSATALHLYTTFDGTEFLKTANVFDLQFVPDCRGFHYPARDVATEAPLSYKEPDFETRVLQHSKVNPTWDDDAPARKVLRRKLECQLDQFLKFAAKYESASYDDVDVSGDGSLSNDVAKRKLTNKKRLALLHQGNTFDEERSDDQGMDMELEDFGKRILERKSNETMKTACEMGQEFMKENRKARKRWSKDDDGCIDEDSADEGKDTVEDKLHVSKDKRLLPMLTSHLYALDPTDPQYKRSVRKQAGKKASKSVDSLKRNSKKAKQE